MNKHAWPQRASSAADFDLLPRTLSLIQSGAMHFTIDQQPYLQGFYTVMQMFTFLASGGLVGPGNCNTGLKFVTKDSVGEYLSTRHAVRGQGGHRQVVPRSGPIAT